MFLDESTGRDGEPLVAAACPAAGGNGRKGVGDGGCVGVIAQDGDPGLWCEQPVGVRVMRVRIGSSTLVAAWFQEPPAGTIMGGVTSV